MGSAGTPSATREGFGGGIRPAGERAAEGDQRVAQGALVFGSRWVPLADSSQRQLPDAAADLPHGLRLLERRHAAPQHDLPPLQPGRSVRPEKRGRCLFHRLCPTRGIRRNDTRHRSGPGARLVLVLAGALEVLSGSTALPAPVAGAERRIAAYLLSRRAAAHGHSALELTHGTIAIELGSAREVVSRVLKELEREGAVALGRGRIELADLGLLRRLADPGTHS